MAQASKEILQENETSTFLLNNLGFEKKYKEFTTNPVKEIQNS